MPHGHTVKVGDDWVDGFLIGKAAAISEWRMRKEIDDPEFKRLVDRLRQRQWWENLDPEMKERVREYRRQWRKDNWEQYYAVMNRAKQRGRQRNAAWYKNAKAKKREKFKAETQRMREEVYTCQESTCGVQFCIGIGPIPSRRPKYCSQACVSRSAHRRAKAAGKPWANRSKHSPRGGTCAHCGGRTSRKRITRCSDCVRSGRGCKKKAG